MATPHNAANKGDIARTVIMPGDPLRAKYIADNFLTDVKCVNEVRGMLAFTGKYKDKEITCMGHGMGIPSVGIYTYELFHLYDVDNIIRIGSAGGLQDDINIKDVVFALSASTDSDYGYQFNIPRGFAPTASFSILDTAIACARENDVPFHVGNVFSSDCFYRSDDMAARLKEFGVLAVEMESAGLYINAAEAKKQALTILTISDHFYKEEELSAEERQTGFIRMMEVALNTAVRL